MRTLQRMEKTKDKKVNTSYYYMRDCRKCGQAYKPTGKYQKCCDNCRYGNNVFIKKIKKSRASRKV